MTEVGEVGDLVCDLRSRRRDQVVEEACRDVLLLRRQLGERPLQVLLDDVLCAAEPLERLHAQRCRSREPLLVPQALHHELEVGRLDARAVVDTLDRSEPSERRLDLPGSDLVQDPVDECGLGDDGDPGELREPLDRALDRGPRSAPVQAIQPKRVGEQAGDSPREAVELRERVLAQRDEDVDPEWCSEHRRQCLGEGLGPAVVGVVEKVLLGLVEDEIDITTGLGLLESSDGRAVRAAAESVRECLRQRCRGIVAPT